MVPPLLGEPSHPGQGLGRAGVNRAATLGRVWTPEVAMQRVQIVIPGDEPPQLQGSPHLDRLRAYGDVVLHADRPATVQEQVRRAREAVCLINSRGSLRWPGVVLRELP